MIHLGTPNLETERLLLRRFVLEDAEDMFQYGCDPEVTKYLSWDTHQTIEDSAGFIKYTLNRYIACQMKPLEKLCKKLECSLRE